MRFLEFLIEQKEKHAVLAFGRMNPITTGHEKLVEAVKSIAKKYGATPYIVVSHSQDSKKNPLSAQQKLQYAKKFFPGVNFSASDKVSPNIFSQASKLYKMGYTHLHVVGGSDRVDEYKNIMNKYNNVKGSHGFYNFKNIMVHSAGERDPDAEGTEGMSASKMREAAKNNDFKTFRKGVPSHATESDAKGLFNDVRHGMGLKESIDFDFEEMLSEGVHDKSIFKAIFLAGGPGSGKDYVLDNTLSGHGLTEINSDKAFEYLMDKKNLDMKMPENEKEARDVVRGRAKSMTELRERLALLGRNGVIINGTGDDPEKIARIKQRLEQIGYETRMIMVNTRDEVSASRNVERGQRGGRTVPEKIRKQKWDSVQAARPELAKLFGDNYTEFDNSEDLRTARPEIVQQKKQEMLDLYKSVQKFVTKPPKNDVSKEWIANELQKADVQKIDTKKEVAPHEGSKAAEEARRMGLKYYGFGRYGKDGKVTHRVIHDKLTDVSKSAQQEPAAREAIRTIAAAGSSGSNITPRQKEKLKTLMSKSKLPKLKEENEPRIPKKPGQPDKSDKHSDLYTDEEPRGTIHGLKFATKEDAEESVRKIKSSDRSHAHKIQAAVAMEQRARVMGKDSAAAVYRKFINSMKESFENTDEEFENLFSEDLRQWFNPSHPKGGWKRVNSKGEVIGPCAREPGEGKPKCLSNEKIGSLSKKERAAAFRAKRKYDPNPERQGKPINVSNFGKGKLSESYDLTDSSALNILLLGNRIDEIDLDDNYIQFEEKKYLKDSSGKIRVFMLRRAATKEAHTKNGTVIPYKNGYIVQLNEETYHGNSTIPERHILGEQIELRETTSAGPNYFTETRARLREYAELTTGQEYARGEGITSARTEAPAAGTKITLAKIRQRQKKAKVKESIDKGIEPGLSMSASGENAGRPSLKTKQNKKPFEEAIGAGGEDANSIGAKKEDELKKVGISLTTFKAKRPIG